LKRKFFLKEAEEHMGKMVESLSPSDSMNEKSQGNKRETTFRKEKEHQNHERETGQLKSMEKQKGHRVN
jgi:hypothetical protein